MTLLGRKVLLALLILTLPAVGIAADRFWLIGGGPSPQSAEAQIEFNVQWVRETLDRLAPDAQVHVFFANGDEGTPSVVEHLSEPDTAAMRFEALARVFGQRDENRLRYREHEVALAEGGTAADSLIPRLGRQLASLEPGEQGMIVYNGHGSWEADRSSNALRLWGESRLDVRTFERLLSEVDPEVPIRFVFTQCFSGAFSRSVHPDAVPSMELAAGQRCGFFAESEDRLSEGCSASIEIGDYRDYTTYFFAALSGETRLGEPVESRDWDGDGRITPFDAHLHTIVEGRNADLPRSTSEDFLERWQPWYLRWVETDELPDNVYGRAAAAIARAAELPEDGRALGAELDRRYAELAREIAGAEAEQGQLAADASAAQRRIQEAVGQRWPHLLHPFTAGFDRTIRGDLPAITTFILEHPEYGELVGMEERDDRLTLELIELERDLSHLERLRRTRMLARALAQIERHGSDGDREVYARLRSCEALPLTSGTARAADGL
jgi:hypothetical protein